MQRARLNLGTSLNYSSHLYILEKSDAATFDDAVNSCRQKNGYLACLNSEEEHDTVKNYIDRSYNPDNPGIVWVGYTWFTSGNCTDEELNCTNTWDLQCDVADDPFDAQSTGEWYIRTVNVTIRSFDEPTQYYAYDTSGSLAFFENNTQHAYICEYNQFCDSDETNPCLNDGICSPDPVSGYSCDCSGTGYTGERCQTEVDECAMMNPCLHGACVDLINNYGCECFNTGYHGRRCEHNINECQSNPCVHGHCDDGVNQYTCDCFYGYMGTHCDQRYQRNSMCGSSGFMGHGCNIDVDECAEDADESACNNNGDCLNYMGGFQCYCYDGFTGDTCAERAESAAAAASASISFASDEEILRLGIAAGVAAFLLLIFFVYLGVTVCRGRKTRKEEMSIIKTLTTELEKGRVSVEPKKVLKTIRESQRPEDIADNIHDAILEAKDSVYGTVFGYFKAGENPFEVPVYTVPTKESSMFTAPKQIKTESKKSIQKANILVKKKSAAQTSVSAKQQTMYRLAGPEVADEHSIKQGFVVDPSMYKKTPSMHDGDRGKVTTPADGRSSSRAGSSREPPPAPSPTGSSRQPPPPSPTGSRPPSPNVPLREGQSGSSFKSATSGEPRQDDDTSKRRKISRGSSERRESPSPEHGRRQDQLQRSATYE